MIDVLTQMRNALPRDNPIGLMTERGGDQQFWVAATQDGTMDPQLESAMLAAFVERPTGMYLASAMFGLTSIERGIAIEFLQTVDYTRLKRLMDDGRPLGAQDLRARLQSVLNRGERDCERVVRYLMAIPPSGGDWIVSAPDALEGIGLGSALMELFSSFVPTGVSISFRIAHQASIRERDAGVQLSETTMLRRWRRVGMELREERDTDGFGQPSVVLAKCDCPEIRANWNDPRRLGPYVVDPA